MPAQTTALPPARRHSPLWFSVRAVALFMVLAVALASALAPAPARAQVAGEVVLDLPQWEAFADQAEMNVAARNLSDDELSALRAGLVEWRSQFLESQGFNRDRIAILREQIDALGPAPAEGEVESPELTERRAELAQRLANRQAPLLTAEEAHRRAEAVIRSIDRLLRERQTESLTRLWPTPLNPANWPEAGDALTSSLLTLSGELHNAWLDPERQAEFWENLPFALILFAMALGLLLRGRSWMESLTARLARSTAILRGRFLAAFLLSLTQIAVPVVGLILFYMAVQMIGLAGTTLDAVIDAVIGGALAVILARWLSLHLFPVVEDAALIIRLDPADRRRARGAILALAVLGAGAMMFEALIQPAQQSDAAVAVLMFPLIVVMALVFWRLGKVIFRHSAGPEVVSPTDSGPGFVDRAVWVGAKVLMGLAIVAPVLAAVGYVSGARELLFPASESLGLIGLVMVLQRLVTAIYEAALGLEEGTSNALVPALAGLLLVLGALPLLAMQWGVRETDLLETWDRFRAGFSLGETRISPANLLYFVIVFSIGYMLTRAVQGALSSSVLPKTTLEKGAQKAIVSGLGYVGIVVAALIAFSTAGIDLSGLAIVAGALTVGIGFGLQNIVSNFVSGVILLIERPVSEGDWVEVGTTQGFISRISVRSTVIDTFDKAEVIVPNSELISGRVTNFTKTNKTGRVIVPVSVAYGSDTRKVEKMLKEIAEAHPIAALDPPPSAMFMGFGADGLDFEVRAILRDVGFKMVVASELRHQIIERFTAEGIEIPFAQRDIWIRNPEALTGRAPQAAPGAAAATEPRDQRIAIPGERPAPELHTDPPAHESVDNDGRSEDEDER